MTDNPIPTLGRIVLAIVDPNANNGADLAPAVITRAWPAAETTDRAPYHWVNYRLLGDSAPSSFDWRVSAQLYADEAAARAALGETGREHPGGMLAFWPPRVDTGAKAQPVSSGQAGPKQHVIHDAVSAPVSRPAQGPGHLIA